MLEIALARINSFGIKPNADFVPASDQLITLTIGQLQELTTLAAKEAIQPLHDEVSQLREERDQDRQKIAELRRMVKNIKVLEEIYHGPDPSQEDLPFIRKYWEVKREEIKDLPMMLKAVEEDLSILEKEVHNKSKPDTPSDLLDMLYKHMKAVGIKQTTFAGAAKILQRSKGRIKQLHSQIACDQRFIIVPSESHKQRLLIRLREFYSAV